MWILAFSLVSLIASTSAFGEGFPVLDAPSNVRVGNESDVEVIIAWEWRRPKDLSLKRVEFVLIIESTKHSTRIFYPRFGSEAFTYRVSNLTPDTKYSLTILATAPNWASSPYAELSFTTMAKDWRAPIIREVIANPLRDVMEYYVRWLLPLTRELTHLEVEICRKSCGHLKVHRSDLNTRVRIPYESKFTLRVAACYNASVVGHLKRYSIRRSNFTGKSPPTRLFSMVNMKTVGNRIKLDWHPSLGPKEPDSYYEVFVCDPSSRSELFGSSLVPKESRIPLQSSRLVGDAFRLSPAPRVTIRRSSTIANHAVLDNEPGSCGISVPLLLVVVRRTQSAVRFRIMFKKSEQGGLSESQARERDLLLGPEVAEAFGFNPDARLYVKIRTCLLNPELGVDVCGNFTDFQMQSNVAEPSAVQNLGWSFPAHNKLEITWDRPAVPRGPIDGYEIIIRISYGNWVTTDGEFVEPNITSFVIDNYNPRISYEISVAGFNVDREDQTLKLVGSYSTVYPSSSWFAHFSWSTSITVITVLLLLTMFASIIVDRRD